MARYRTELREKALLSEQAYQNAVDRLADVKRHESLCLLKTATVQNILISIFLLKILTINYIEFIRFIINYFN